MQNSGGASLPSLTNQFRVVLRVLCMVEVSVGRARKGISKSFRATAESNCERAAAPASAEFAHAEY